MEPEKHNAGSIGIARICVDRYDDIISEKTTSGVGFSGWKSPCLVQHFVLYFDITGIQRLFTDLRCYFRAVYFFLELRKAVYQSDFWKKDTRKNKSKPRFYC